MSELKGERVILNNIADDLILKGIDLQEKMNLMTKIMTQLIENSAVEAVQITHRLKKSSPAERAKAIYLHRRRREQVFGRDLFGDPAWDILLDLFVAQQGGKQISITSACIGAEVPPTTGLRWIKLLEERGLIMRDGDERDARRSNVRLTSLAWEIMDQYLEAL